MGTTTATRIVLRLKSEPVTETSVTAHDLASTISRNRSMLMKFVKKQP